MEKQKNVPALRFPEFEGEWEGKKLGDIGEVKMCRRIFNEETSPVGEIPFFKIGSFGKMADAYISKQLYLEYRKKYPFPKRGDILISAAGTIGRTVVYDGEDAYYQDSNIVWIDNDNIKVTNEFLYYILQIVKYNTEGGTIQRLYNNILKSTKFSCPTVPEQTKIAHFLTAIDTKIQQLTQKKALLEQYKKGVMQQLFSQKIRFKDENGEDYPDWEEKKLGEVGEVKMCRRIFNEETSPTGEIPFFKIGSFGKEADAFISKKLYLEYRKKYPFPKKGDILISAAGTIGRTVIYNGDDAYYQDSNIVWIDNDNTKVTNEFLYYVLQIVKYNTEGGTIQRLYNNILKSTKFISPSLPEQTKIANFLTAIDTKIETVAKQIEQTQAYKKGLLQQMFI